MKGWEGRLVCCVLPQRGRTGKFHWSPPGFGYPPEEESGQTTQQQVYESPNAHDTSTSFRCRALPTARRHLKAYYE
jgi:hypothetical protein